MARKPSSAGSGLIPQNAAQDLARRRLRDDVHEVELPDLLVGRNAPGDEGDDVIRRRCPARLQHHEPHRDPPRGTAWWRTAALLKAHPRAPEVVLVTRRISDIEVAALHQRGDCYLSLSHAEGWGVGPFDAAAWGNPTIVSGWGGVRDYLDESSAFFIDHELVPVEPPPGQRSYTADQRWSEPSFDHAVALLREVARDRAAARERGHRAQRTVQERFAPPVVAARCREVLSLADDRRTPPPRPAPK
jgi:glycosyltransferase involved in cell wall biosynthesis